MKYNKTIIIISFLGLAVFILAGFIFQKVTLPDSFIIVAKRDDTSSAAGRLHKTTLTFVKGQIQSGVMTYEAGGGNHDGTNGTWSVYKECVVQDGDWVNNLEEGLCTIDEGGGIPYLMITPLQLATQIKTGQIKTGEECQRFDVCYEITPIE